MTEPTEAAPMFDYEDVRKNFEENLPRKVLTFVRNGKHEDTLDSLKLVKHPEEEPYIEIDGKGLFYINGWDYEDLDELDLSNSHLLQQMVKPIFPGEDGEGWQQDYEWDKVTWLEGEEHQLTTISQGGVTDFYDKNGVWPHFVVKKQVKRLLGADREVEGHIPLVFVGEIVINNRKAHVFYGADHRFPLRNVQLSQYDVDKATAEKFDSTWAPYAVIFEDSLSTSSDIVLKAVDEVPQPESETRYVASGRVPLAPDWIQYFETLESPHNKYVGVFPAVGDIMYGDVGSLYFFWDGGDSVKVIMQCS